MQAVDSSSADYISHSRFSHGKSSLSAVALEASSLGLPFLELVFLGPAFLGSAFLGPVILGPAVLWPPFLVPAFLAASHAPPAPRSPVLPVSAAHRLPIDCRIWGLKTPVARGAHRRQCLGGSQNPKSSTSREMFEKSVGKRRLGAGRNLEARVWTYYQHHGDGRPGEDRVSKGNSFNWRKSQQHTYLENRPPLHDRERKKTIRGRRGVTARARRIPALPVSRGVTWVGAVAESEAALLPLLVRPPPAL